MKVFVDTNVIIEYLIARERVGAAKQVIDWLVENRNDIYMSVGGFYTILYSVDKYIRKELFPPKDLRLNMLRGIARGLLANYRVAEHDNKTLLQAITDLRFSDLEDSCQLQAAIKCGCQILLTFNNKDYPTTDSMPIKVLTPETFIETHIKGAE